MMPSNCCVADATTNEIFTSRIAKNIQQKTMKNHIETKISAVHRQYNGQRHFASATTPLLPLLTFWFDLRARR